MRRFFSLFKRRWFIALIGLLLVSILIWFAGPYLAFAERRPLDSALERGITIFVLFLVWVGWLQLKFFLAWRATRKLAQQVAEQPAAPVVATRPDEKEGDANELRAQFTEAVAALRKGPRRASLYDLPWYVIIGPPGSGKTTVLANSSLNFPLEQKFGRDAVRGVGGTRNCDWWFTDEGVFLDTAGRYTTQDSDRAADSAGWAAFLGLLKNYRPRRPINGVIVALSLSDVMTQGEEGLAADVLAVRGRLEELHRHLGVALPVYLMFTKTDLVAGFSEFFDDLNADGRAQVWGMTFPIEATRSGHAPQLFAQEFDALVSRLNERVLQRLSQDNDPRRRAAMFAFPSQMAALRNLLGTFVKETFVSTRFEGRLLLRGVYLTSGTQEGTPIDRMVGAVARSFGLDAQAMAPPAGRGRAYFIERLFRAVMFAESGLAGVDRRSMVRKAVLSGAGYIGLTLVAVLGVIALSVSYALNRGYLLDVAQSLEAYPGERPTVAAPGPAAVIRAALPRLNALWATVQEAERYREERPWSMRWGLFQGSATASSVRDAYVREMSGGLLPALGAHFRTRLAAQAAAPERLYEYLKAYLMLGKPERLDPEQLRILAQLELGRVFRDAPEVRDLSLLHFGNLVADEDRLRPLPLDEALIQRAREALRNASLPLLAYLRIKLQREADAKRALRLDIATGLGSERVLARRSGKSLADPVPSIYTRPVFEEVVGAGGTALIQEFTRDSWVMGDDKLDLTAATRLAQDTLLVYEQDYARFWRELLADIVLVTPGDLQQLRELLSLLSGPTSPLRALLVVVADHTNLTKQTFARGAAGEILEDQARDLRTGKLGQVLMAGVDAASQSAPELPGSRVTGEFRPLRELVEGPAGSAPIDRALALIGQMNQRVQAMGGGIGQASALDVLTQSGSGQALKDLQFAAKRMPEPVSGLLQQLGGQSESLASGAARGEMSARMEENVTRDCSLVTRGRYPFEAGAGLDVPLGDFGRVFGYSGAFDKFFQEKLAALVDTSRSPWQPKEGAAGIGVDPGMLAQFQNARQIRDMFFKPGAQVPEVRFTLMPETLSAQSLGVILELHGARYEYRHGPVSNWNVQWPDNGNMTAAISFRDAKGTTPNLAFQGPWALFRLLDRANVKPRGDNFTASFYVGGHSARFVIVPASLHNPFGGMPVVRRFRCGE